MGRTRSPSVCGGLEITGFCKLNITLNTIRRSFLGTGGYVHDEIGSTMRVVTLLELQSRFGDKPLKFQVVYP